MEKIVVCCQDMETDSYVAGECKLEGSLTVKYQNFKYTYVYPLKPPFPFLSILRI